MAEKERKRVDDLPAGAVKQVRELLNRPRSSADFSPAARYAVSKLCDYAEQEHELRSKAEERCAKMDRQVADACHMVETQARTIDDLRQQLSFMQQARWDAVEFFSEFRRMCKSTSDCTKCEYHGDKCDNAIELFEKTVAVVKQWSKEHPRKTKTRQDVFLSVYPNAKMDKRSRTVDVSPCFVDKSWSANGCPNNDCAVCRRQFWMQEVE